MTFLTQRKTLELELKCDRHNKTIFAHQYATSPLRLSQIFRLEGVESTRAYVYLMNSSPGLLAGDRLSLSLQLKANTSLYLTEQAATKVHAMPQADTKATTNWDIIVDEKVSLELVPEPVILFADSALEQTTSIKLYPRSSLFWSEILLPGRLARGESYDFRYYHSSLELYDSTGKLWFKDATHLEGKHNPWNHSGLFAAQPILANIILVQPQVDLKLLSQKLENWTSENLTVATSALPENKGLVIRAMANKTAPIKKYLNYALNCMRGMSNLASLPYIPK